MNLSEKRPPTYPVNIKLAGVPCLVVGGGGVALRKVRDLLQAGARVRLVSPEVDPEVSELIGSGLVDRRTGKFRPEDADGVRLAIAATDKADVNAAVLDACRARGVWVNVVDDPDRCDFYVPAVLNRGNITVAVSTAGSSPALAGHIRDRIAEAVGPEYETLAEILGDLRDRIRREVPSGKRLQVYRTIIDSPVLSMVRAGRGRTEIMTEIDRCISSVSD